VGKDAVVINVSFLQPDGTTKTVPAKVGETLLQTAHNHDIELEGACEGKHVRGNSLRIVHVYIYVHLRILYLWPCIDTRKRMYMSSNSPLARSFSCPYLFPFFLYVPTGVCACSTCHVILPDDVFSSLPEASEDEEDMLDMAFGLTDTSRLGCQITITPDMEGVVWEMPKATRNFYVDGHVAKPH
jgi:ferredoxin